MIEIEIDGRSVWYYPSGEEVPPDVTAQVLRYSFRLDSMTMHAPGMRQVVVPNVSRSATPHRMAVLHWDDGTDLDQLDRLAVDGDDITTAIARALLCEVRGVQCLSCDNHHVLAVPDGALPGSRADRASRHHLSTDCPTCGHDRFPRHAADFNV